MSNMLKRSYLRRQIFLALLLVLACVGSGAGYSWWQAEQTKVATRFSVVLSEASHATEELLQAINRLDTIRTDTNIAMKPAFERDKIIAEGKAGLTKPLADLQAVFEALEWTTQRDVVMTESKRLTMSENGSAAPAIDARFEPIAAYNMPQALQVIWIGDDTRAGLRNAIREVITQADRISIYNNFASRSVQRTFKSIMTLAEERVHPVLEEVTEQLNEEVVGLQAQLQNAIMLSALLTVVAAALAGLAILMPLEKAISQSQHGLDVARREAERARRAAQTSDRAKSEFLANMSHEIRTPMNGVLGMAELLAKTDLDKRQKTFTDVIVKSGNALLTIINDILDFSKIDAGQLELDPAPFRLAEAVEDVATLVSARVAEKDLELIVRVDPDLPTMVTGDVGRFRQIVTNLMGNAVKFTEAGHVLVDVSGETVDGVAQLKVAVTDTGIGIPADKLDLVFEKFAQVDASSTRRHEGTGLGLAIASRLVELMDGEMGAESAVGEGSTFWFTARLPVAQSAARRSAPPVDVTGARILVIDDNPVNRDILSEQLKSWNFECAAAESGAVGLAFVEQAAAMGVTVDGIILDYQMPGMNGEEVMERLRAMPSGRDLPVILLTSVDQAGYGRMAFEHGIAAHLTKPARSSLLLETIVDMLQKARADAGRAAGAERLAARPYGQSQEATPARRVEVPATQAGPVERVAAPAPNQTQAGQNHGAGTLAGLAERLREQEPRTPANAPAAAPAAAPNSVQTAAPASSGEKRWPQKSPERLDVLVAEDNEVNQLVFSQILAGLGVTFRIVGNGKLAVQAQAEYDPTVIVMDVSMPEMNGLEATAEIRKANAASGRHTPIIGVTAHALKGDREKCIEAGMDDYMSKPVSPDRLAELVNTWMDKAKAKAA